MADEPQDAVTNDAGIAAPSPGAADSRPGDFERYALIAAMTLVVLCLLLWDRWQRAPSANPVPSTDRTLRVEIGGDVRPGEHRAAPAVPPQDGRASPRVTNDPPAPAPPPPAPRTYAVKDGDTLYEIAKRELGASSRAKEIADLNGIADASKLKLGQVLKLPAK
jgi:nucleoid-associated protein YgaU